MMDKTFTDEADAKKYREAQRDAGLAASLFNYGQGRFLVKVRSTDSDTQSTKGRTQMFLTNEAWRVSDEVESLYKIRALLADTNFGEDIEDVTLVAKYLNGITWFSTPTAVIEFFEGLSTTDLGTLKNEIDSYIKEYDDAWEEYKKEDSDATTDSTKVTG